MQYFNTSLDVTVAQASMFLRERGLADTSHWVVRYVDTVLVGSPSEQGHEDALKRIFYVFRSHGWTMNASKGQWLTDEIDILGPN